MKKNHQLHSDHRQSNGVNPSSNSSESDNKTHLPTTSDSTCNQQPSFPKIQRVTAPTFTDSRILLLKPHRTIPSSFPDLKRPALRVSGQLPADIISIHLAACLNIDIEKERIVLICQGVEIEPVMTMDVLYMEVFEEEAQWIELQYKLVAKQEAEIDC